MQQLKASQPSDTRKFAQALIPKCARELSQYADLHYMCSTEAREWYDDPEQNDRPKDIKHDTLWKQQWCKTHFARR